MNDRAKARKEERRATRHSDSSVYIVWVLWVIGLSEAAIGSVVGKRRKQIAGIVSRSPYANRSAMTPDDRQKALNELLQVRHGDDGQPIDGGVLDRVPHQVIDLRGRQRKRSA